jgi:predicted transcriptional regulator
MNVLFSLTPKSEVAYLYDDYSLRQALEKMEHYRYSAVPIIDRAGCYVGTLTEGDLLWYIKDHKISDIHTTEEVPLSKVKRRWYNEPVNIDCEIEDLILTSMNQNFVPVVDGRNVFIGIITRKEIIKELLKQKNSNVIQKSPLVEQRADSAQQAGQAFH